MSNNHGVLALVDDAELRADVERVAAAAGTRLVHAAEPSSSKSWAAAAAVVVDVASAVRCAKRALPRRTSVIVVGRAEPDPADWPAMLALGAQCVLILPEQDGELVAVLTDAAETGRRTRRRGAVLAVVGARGGAGASVFATALARAATDPLLVDVDPWGGGLDLLLGSENLPGLRWPDVALHGGRVGWSALRAALPVHRGVAVLSAGRTGDTLDAAAVDAIIDAGTRGGATVICDLPRHATTTVETVLAAADLVTVITPADVRSSVAAGAVGRWSSNVNANVGLVVRGPSPGGLTASEVARAVGLPLLVGMRAQPGLAAKLEHAGLEPRPRSPLSAAARRVLAMVERGPVERSTAERVPA